MGTVNRVLPALMAAALVVAVPSVGAGRAAEQLPGCAEPGHQGGDWPVYGRDLANSRHQADETEIGPTEAATLAPVWTFSSVGADPDGGTGGDFTGTPVVADGCVYAASNSGWVFAANADTGETVWASPVPDGGGVNSSVAVDGGLVYAAVSRSGSPYVVAFDQATGALEWNSGAIDEQGGNDIYASPVVHDGLVIVGVSGGAAELGDETDRYAFQGSVSLLDAADGSVVEKIWTIQPPAETQPTEDECSGAAPPDACFAGAAVWSTAAVDPAAGVAYLGTGNPFRPEQEHSHANAVLEIDVDQSSPTFGEILAHYKGTVDEYVPGFSDLPCQSIPGNPPPYYPQGVGSCGDIDLDFGASVNLLDADGRTVAGAGQKSGIYHAFDPDDVVPTETTPGPPASPQMQGLWSSIVGPPTPVGGVVGSTAYDGESVTGPVTVPGHIWSLAAADGSLEWVSPVGDAVHWGNPVASANGVVYTVDLKGFLDAYDAETGAPLLHRPIVAGAETGGDPVLSWGGVSVARNTVYVAVGITGLPNGFVVAFQPGGAGGLPEPPEPPPGPDLPVAGSAVVAGPGAQFYNYATPVMVLQQGERLTFTNADVVLHDVDSPAWGDTALVGVGGSYEVPTDSLAPGEYPFFCSIHPRMQGTLLVV